MNQVFDPLNLLILAVAVVILLRLRSVLGTRTGHERRYDPYSATEAAEKARRGEGKVIPLPGSKPAEEIQASDSANQPVWQGVAEEGSNLAKSLEKLARADKSFEVQSFLEGAKMAYEMIVTAFAEGDRKSLKPLLSKDVYEGFAAAIAEREKAGETIDTQIVGIDKADIVAASVNGRRASITVKFQSQMITVKRDGEGAAIEGDERAIQNITDVWSFDRDVTARDPNWRLVATEET
jgi:predicted lipid-binding transport protein (Tim44 family)